VIELDMLNISEIDLKNKPVLDERVLKVRGAVIDLIIFVSLDVIAEVLKD
jgi:hypothetical protein